MRKPGGGFRLMAIFLFFLILAAGSGVEAAAPLAGKLIQVQGQVEVRPAAAPQWQPGRINQDLLAGDAVRTGPVSRAAILCVDESQIKLNENTVFLLKSAAPSPRLGWGAPLPAAAPPAAASLYQVPQGEMWLRNSNEKFRFELETPAVTAAVRGTEFNLRVAADGATSLALLTGALVLRNPQGQVSLAPGEEGLARPGEPPSKRVVVAPADAVQWSLFYPGIISYRDLPLSGADSGGRAAGPPAAASLVRQAEASYDQGKLEQARQEAEEALRLAPDHPGALTVLGWLSLQRHDPEAAAGFFRRVAVPDEAAVIGHALALYRLGQVAQAYQLMEQARGRLPATPYFTAMCGYFALMAGQAGQAQKLCDAALARDPRAVLPRTFLAQIYLVQNRKEAARRAAGEALAANPDSPAALLTTALVDMAFFDLKSARLHLEKALRADPAFVDAYVYLARLWLGGDYLDRARRTIDIALKLAPREAEVLSMAGFIRLGYRDYQGAKEFFTRALAANPRFGDPHLGLGHYHFRYRDFQQGLAEILTATLLEPRVSSFQSFLGKALYQMRVFDKALETYDYAKTLDPRDPTPHLYKGIALTDLNRPGEAIQEINRSIELNDNQAVVRSRLGLDRDLAVRNYNLAYAYNYLGLDDWAYSKALTSVKKDPTNSSSQLFLAKAFLDSHQRVGAGLSALLLFRLLSPANQNTFAIGNDYTPMFEMPYIRMLTSATGGVWNRSGQTIQEYSLEVYGGLPGLAADLYGNYSQDEGFQNLNGHERFKFLSGLFKWDVTPKTSLYFLSSYFDIFSGDNSFLLNPYHNSPFYRRFSLIRQMEGGLVHRFSPAAIFLAYLNHRHLTNWTSNMTLGRGSLPYVVGPFTSTFFPPGWYYYDYGTVTYDTRNYTQTRNSLTIFNPQVQQMLILGNHTLLFGFDYLRGQGNNRSADMLRLLYRYFIYGNETLVYDNNGNLRYDGPLWEPYRAPLTSRSTLSEYLSYGFPEWSYTAYLLDYWRVGEKLLVELGVTHKGAKTPNYQVDRRITKTLWSPRLGLNYFITPQQVVRLGAYTGLSSFAGKGSIMPTEVAGVPTDINAYEGAEIREVGLSWEAQWSPTTFTVLKGGALRVANPQIIALTAPITYYNWKEYYAYLGFNQILGPFWGLYLGGVWKRFDTQTVENVDFTEIDGLARLSFWHASGFRAYVASTLIYQQARRRHAELFVLADAGVGYEFPGKRGVIKCQVKNIFDRRFAYLTEPIKLDPFFAARRITLNLSLYF